jgi:endonuclease YncB( thermonuclease family)
MFHRARRLLLIVCVGGILSAVVYVWQFTDLLQPVYELYGLVKEADWEGEKVRGQVTGQVIAIRDGVGFLMKDGANQTFYFGLSGIEAPKKPTKGQRREGSLAAQSKTNLTNLILSNTVRVDITYTNDYRSGLGVVYMDRTNVNARVVEAGMATINRRFLRGLPLAEQYALLRAEKRAQQARVGLWRGEADSSMSP